MNLSLKPETTQIMIIDAQNLFCEGSPWACRGFEAIVPKLRALAEAAFLPPVFTRFIPPPEKAADGAWETYWRKWRALNAEAIAPSMLDIVPELAPAARRGWIWDKRVYAPWAEKGIGQTLSPEATPNLILAGAETDICVLATAFGAIDLGFRVILVEDALTSSSRTGHEAALTLCKIRLPQQIIVTSLEKVLNALA